MRTGRFPDRNTPPPQYERGHWSGNELDPPTVSRRGVIAGLGWAVAGAAIPTWVLVGREPEADPHRGPVRAAGPARVAGPARPAWVTDMLELDANALIERAGEFEMLSRQQAGDDGVSPGFERLLRVAIRSRHAHRDLAAACAIRSLARLDRIERVRSWTMRLSRIGGFPNATEAARQEIEAKRLERRSRGGR